VRFDQIGIVNNKQELSSYIAARGLEKVVCFHGQIPHEETLRLMASADVFLLSQPGTSLQVPGKLYEMLPFRRPIVALTEAQGATADIITGYGLGPPPSENTEAIASAILSAADRHGIYSWNGAWENALRAFDGRVLTGHLAEVLNECRSA
jgi:glycosyltransferase involved in cell wall biosynthesis